MDMSQNIKTKGHSRLNSQYQNFYRFLHLMREARQREHRTGNQISETESTTPESPQDGEECVAQANTVVGPSTSVQAALNELASSLPSTSTGVAESLNLAANEPRLMGAKRRIYVKIVNSNETHEEDEDEDEASLSSETEDDEEELRSHRNSQLAPRDSDEYVNSKLNPDESRVNGKKSAPISLA